MIALRHISWGRYRTFSKERWRSNIFVQTKMTIKCSSRKSRGPSIETTLFDGMDRKQRKITSVENTKIHTYQQQKSRYRFNESKHTETESWLPAATVCSVIV